MLIVLAALGLLLAGSLVYSLLSVMAALRYLAVARMPQPAASEPISVLKPLSGLDEGLEENLRSFFEQDYLQFELVFAVREESDPCVPLVRRLCAEYARVPSPLILFADPPYFHPKASPLA